MNMARILLPAWEIQPLYTVATTQLGKTINPKEKNSPRQRPYLRSANVRWDEFNLADVYTMHFGEKESQQFSLEPGDLLVCEGGDVGRAAIWNGQIADCHFQNALHRVRPRDDAVTAAWLLENLRYLAGTGEIARRARGNTILHLSQTEIRNLPIVVPPRHVQDDVVSLLAEVRHRRSSCCIHLATARQVIERFRQAVLAAACGGRLTADWREAAETTESGATLLRRASAREVQRKHRINATEVEEPKGLPSSWAWATPSQICDEIVDCPHSTPKYGIGDHLALDTTSMSESGIVIDRLRRITAQTFHDRNKRLVPEAGDVVFAREGTVGTAVVVPDDLHVCLGQRVMLLRPSDFVLSDYLRYTLMSPQTRAQYADKLLGTTVAHINVRDVIRLGIPLPPMDEQRIIVRRVSEMLQLADTLLSRVRSAERRVERAGQATLARAFHGELALAGSEVVGGEPVSEGAPK